MRNPKRNVTNTGESKIGAHISLTDQMFRILMVPS